jgi:hypothetical protein
MSVTVDCFDLHSAIGRLGERATDNCIGETRPGYQHCEAFFGGFSVKGSGEKTIQYNDTRDANERATFV